jgi:hypothetical protein
MLLFNFLLEVAIGFDIVFFMLQKINLSLQQEWQLKLIENFFQIFWLFGPALPYHRGSLLGW